MVDKEILLALIRTIIILPIVLVLAYFFIKYGLARRMLINDGKRRMRMIEQIPLGQKTAISLVEVGGKYILLGHSESGFCIIKEMDELPDPLTYSESEIIDWKNVADKAKVFFFRNKKM